MQEKPAIFTPDKEIRIRRSRLALLEDALEDLVHELAHAEGAKDLTKEMIIKVSEVGALLLYPFAKRMRVSRNLSGEVVVSN